MEHREVWFHELYLKHRKRLLRTAYAITGDLQDSEDLVEAVFEKLYEKYETVKDHENPAGWLGKALYYQLGSDTQKAYHRRETAFVPAQIADYLDGTVSKEEIVQIIESVCEE